MGSRRGLLFVFILEMILKQQYILPNNSINVIPKPIQHAAYTELSTTSDDYAYKLKYNQAYFHKDETGVPKMRKGEVVRAEARGPVGSWGWGRKLPTHIWDVWASAVSSRAGVRGRAAADK